MKLQLSAAALALAGFAPPAHAQAPESPPLPGYWGVRLLEVSEAIASRPPMPLAQFARAEAAQDASTPVQPGMVQAGVTVTVKYDMTR